jgi:hypothetical protein
MISPTKVKEVLDTVESIRETFPHSKLTVSELTDLVVKLEMLEVLERMAPSRNNFGPR